MRTRASTALYKNFREEKKNLSTLRLHVVRNLAIALSQINIIPCRLREKHIQVFWKRAVHVSMANYLFLIITVEVLHTYTHMRVNFVGWDGKNINEQE